MWLQRRVAAAVEITWDTTDDTGIQGFFVERADASNQYQRLNISMIPALGNVAGSSYAYTDTSALAGVEYAYRIVIIEAGNMESIKGPYRRLARQQVAMMIPAEADVRWLSNEGETYSVERSPSLSNPVWTTIATGEAATPPENGLRRCDSRW